MTQRGTAFAATLLVIGLAGCSGSSTPSASAPATPATTTTVTTSTPPPTPKYASENEVASVIAGYEKDWREVDEQGGGCRLAHVIKEDSGVSEIELITCYTNEITAGVQAQNAIRELRALDIPPSMQSLVDETTRVLQGMADVDLEAACGPAFEVPDNSKACSEALGSRMTSYFLLSGVLDKWGPYL